MCIRDSPQENLKEVRRVLKTGGTFLLVADIYEKPGLPREVKDNIRKFHLFNPTREPVSYTHLFRNLTDPLYSAKQHHGNESGNENTEDQIGTFIYSVVDDMQVVQCRMNRRNNGINLGGVSCAEHSQDAEQGIKKMCIRDRNR